MLEELEGCGERVIFADAFSHSLQAPGLLVDGGTDGFLPGGAWNGSYFPATGFPFPNVEAVAVAHPG
jgi:hypothetical protein